MTKIQVIIDDEQSIKAFTCTDLQVFDIPAYEGFRWLHSNPHYYQFICEHIVADESTNLISLPDELLLRIRDHNIDVEHKLAIEQTLKLKEEIESLKDQVRGWELRRDLTIEEYQEYRKEIDKMVDEYPEVVAEVLCRDGNARAAEYFAQKSNEEEPTDESPEL